MSNHYLDLPALCQKLDQLPKERLAIGLFVNFTNVSQDEWLNPLAASLRAAGHAVFGLVTPRSVDKCQLGDTSCAALVSQEDVARLNRINAFVLSDMDHSSALFPVTSRILGVCHTFELATDSALPLSIALSALLDGWLCPWRLTQNARENIAELWTGMAQAGPRSQGDFLIIPAGSPRMAALHAHMTASNTEPDSIVYAPCRINYDLAKGGERVKRYGSQIIRTALSARPGMNVIFRPYREDLENEVVKNLLAEFASEPRFILDARPDRLFSWTRGATLVTDISHAAQSFAFSTMRPAIRYEPWLDRDASPTAWEGGLRATCEKALKAAIEACLMDNGPARERVQRELDARAMPYVNAFTEITNLLPDFISGAKRPEWLAINRRAPISDRDLLSRLVMRREYSSALPEMSVAAATYAKKASPLLTAFALSRCRASRGSHLVFLPFRSKLERLLPARAAEIRNCYRYKDFAKEMDEELAKMALLEKAKERDAHGVALAQALLDETK